MCTAISCSAGRHYFGRNLDLEYAFKECITITPRNFLLHFQTLPALQNHHAMIGMATVANGYPLYYEATNEKGLSAAGLNFPGLAIYHPIAEYKDNVAPYEFIPWILGQCTTVLEAKKLLERTNITAIAFSSQFPLSPLHWIISDEKESIVVESVADVLTVYDNPIGILTNNPPFPWHLYHLANFMQLSARQAENHFTAAISLKPYSNGMGAMGLPGDFSSASRFVRAAFVKENAVFTEDENRNVSQFFHILNSVAMPRGSVVMSDGRNEITLYSSCCDTARGIYYFTSYDNSTIRAVDMHATNLDGDILKTYPLENEPNIQICHVT